LELGVHEKKQTSPTLGCPTNVAEVAGSSPVASPWLHLAANQMSTDKAGWG